MFIRAAVGLFLGCFAVFLVAKLLLFFTFFVIAALLIKFAVLLLLSAFVLLILTALFGVLRHVVAAMRRYFSAPARERRRVAFASVQHVNAQRLFHFQRLQLGYFKEIQRQRVLEKDTKAHINKLAQAIEIELQRVKPLLPSATFRQFMRKNQRYRMQQNAKALLELHNQIATLTRK
ncbi:MAG TPA: hypothetical protein DF614_02240 [Methylococcaceae bacterium]|nr:hypothetical protein [Methylococcaceae bacterium]